MDVKFLAVQKIKLAYKENESAGKTIFFIHGNSTSSNTWKNQFGNSLFSEYRQIAIDLPGHGDSQHSNNPYEDYTPIGTAKILAEAVADLCNNKPYILVAFSYGTNLVAEMMKFGVKPAGIVLIGLCCLGQNFGVEKVFKPQPAAGVFFYNEKNKEVVAQAIASYVKFHNDVMFLTDDYLITDEQFKPVMIQAATEGKITDEIVALQKTGIPICIINGALDNLFYPDYIINSDINFWRGRINILENAGHWVHLDEPEKVNNIIVAYAKETLHQPVF